MAHAKYYRRKAAHLCVKCGEPALVGTRCTMCSFMESHWKDGTWILAVKRCKTEIARKVLINEWKRTERRTGAWLHPES